MTIKWHPKFMIKIGSASDQRISRSNAKIKPHLIIEPVISIDPGVVIRGLGKSVCYLRNTEKISM